VTVVDLFAGMGGWDLSARDFGLDPLGIEHNPAACATREAAGLATLQADIAALDPADFAPCDGLIASPPCQDFSVAGKGAGREGERGQLVDEVVRWVDALRPRWVACEQVPPVLPIWREFAHLFEQWGYRCWTGLLSSERYGVPQTRERAILVASLDGPVQPPAPTHQEYRHGEPARREVGLFGDLKPWVSMAEALGWGDKALRQWRGEGMVERHGERPDRESDEPAFAVTGADHRTKLVVNTGQNFAEAGNRASAQTFDATSRPARVITGKTGGQWQLQGGAAEHATVRHAHAPAPTILGNVGKNGGWVWERPATTIAGDPRCFQPGGHHEPGQQSENAIRLTVPEGLILQGFPPDWPVQGTKTAQWLQIGNAIPPPLAKAILGQLVPAHEAAA
jgi:DNA (cytosine-5)-methyltransferase 1